MRSNNRQYTDSSFTLLVRILFGVCNLNGFSANVRSFRLSISHKTNGGSTKKIISGVIFTALLITIGVAQAAGQHAGKITTYHLNGDVPGRGVCIQMQPLIPTPQGWACLQKDNALYKEITALLLSGNVTEKNCEIAWGTTGAGGFPIITWASCY